MSSTMLLGTLLKVQQLIYDNKVAAVKTSECNHISVCMIAMAVSSFLHYISRKIVHVISEKTSKCNHIVKCVHDNYGSIFLQSYNYI